MLPGEVIWQKFGYAQDSSCVPSTPLFFPIWLTAAGIQTAYETMAFDT